MAEGELTIATNRRARHDYHLLDRVEAGLALRGTEVKSLRAGNVVLRDAYATERNGEMWLVGATIEPYKQANRENHEPTRDRKLLLKRPEIERFAARAAERGLTIVPTRLYFRNGKAKVEIALAKGKEGRDKRQAIAERDVRRELDRALKERRR
jgi:SsrA-binding protein